MKLTKTELLKNAIAKNEAFEAGVKEHYNVSLEDIGTVLTMDNVQMYIDLGNKYELTDEESKVLEQHKASF